MKNLSHVYFNGKAAAPPCSGRRASGRSNTIIPPIGVSTVQNATGDTPPIGRFMEWLFDQAGMDVWAYQPRVVERRFKACLRHLGARSGETAWELLKGRPDLLRSTFEVALIGVSSFFRDSEVFEGLRAVIGAKAHSGGTGLRVLSAGASDGQELYSLGMLLDEMDVLRGSDLLGVDCRRPAVDRAREGVFEERELKGLDLGRRARYFSSKQGRFHVCPLLQSVSRWQTADILVFRESRPFDLILCRNVSIYLTSVKTRQLWDNLARQLRPGGFLVTGKAEKPSPGLPFLGLSPCLYRKIQ